MENVPMTVTDHVQAMERELDDLREEVQRLRQSKREPRDLTISTLKAYVALTRDPETGMSGSGDFRHAYYRQQKDLLPEVFEFMGMLATFAATDRLEPEIFLAIAARCIRLYEEGPPSKEIPF